MATPTTSGNVQERGSKTATAFGFKADPNSGVYSPAADEVAVAAGGTEHLRVGGNYRSPKVVKVALAAVRTAGGVLAWANPEGVAIIVTRLVIDITTAGTSGTANFGVAANGTTSSDNLMDGVSVTGTGAFDNVENQGTNGKSAVKMTSSQFITGSEDAASDVTGLVGSAYIEYYIA